MNYLDLLKRSQARSLDNAYVLINREDYLYTHTVERIVSDCLDEAFLAFNLVRIDGETAQADQVLNALMTLPMMSDCKIHVIENLDKISMGEDQLNQIIRLAMDSVGSVTLFSFAQKKSKAYNLLKKESVEVVEFTKLPEDQFRKWVIKRFREKQCRLSTQALQFFLEYSMYSDRDQQISLYHMENEIEKIASLSAREISVDLLRQVMIMPLEMNVFSLTDHLAKGELKQGYEKLDELMAKGHGVYELMPLLTKTYHNMALARTLSDKGHPLANIRDALGFKSDYPVRMLLQRASRKDRCDLLENLETCIDFESRLKSSSLDTRLHLENLMLRLSQ